jgi:hypothetical protein
LLFFQAKGEQKAMQTATNTPGQGRVGAFSTSQHYLGNSLSCLFGNDNLATTSASRVCIEITQMSVITQNSDKICLSCLFGNDKIATTSVSRV